jgi:hypothetical protein
VEAAQGLAERILEKTPTDIDEKLKTGYRMAMFREIEVEKLNELKSLYQQTKDHFREHPQEVEELTGKKDVELATLTIVSNAIMNLDEFLTKS